MTYRIDRSQFVENGPTVTADTAIARIRRAAFNAAFEARQETPLKHAA